MAVDARRDESGQSLLEFILMLPLLLGLTVIVIRVNTAIQISIVNQKYARMHALWLAFNSPVYPERAFRSGPHDIFTARKYNRMIIGVAANQAEDDGSFKPEAMVQGVTRKTSSNKGATSEPEPDRQSDVRIRSTVTLCTQSNVVMAGTGLISIEAASATPAVAAGLKPESFAFCRSPLPE